jgi:hypothetical protein
MIAIISVIGRQVFFSKSSRILKGDCSVSSNHREEKRATGFICMLLLASIYLIYFVVGDSSSSSSRIPCNNYMMYVKAKPTHT